MINKVLRPIWPGWRKALLGWWCSERHLGCRTCRPLLTWHQTGTACLWSCKPRPTKGTCLLLRLAWHLERWSRDQFVTWEYVPFKNCQGLDWLPKGACTPHVESVQTRHLCLAEIIITRMFSADTQGSQQKFCRLIPVIFLKYQPETFP